FIIDGNQFEDILGGTANGVGLTYSSVNTNGGVIANNYFVLGGSAFAMYIGGAQRAANNPINLTINNNQRIGGSGMLNTLTGSITASTLLSNNYPLDTLDV